MTSVDETCTVTRFNAKRHGILAKHTILPGEDPEQYAELLQSLIAEHQPQGPTELALVEDVANCLWRKRRSLIADAAANATVAPLVLAAFEYSAEGAAAMTALDRRCRSPIVQDPALLPAIIASTKTA